MNDKEQPIYKRGERATWVTLLRTAFKALGYGSDETKEYTWAHEREGALLELRALCADFGDNDWGEDADLAQIIKGHLANHLATDTDKVPGSHRCHQCEEIKLDVEWVHDPYTFQTQEDETLYWICKRCQAKRLLEAEHYFE